MIKVRKCALQPLPFDLHAALREAPDPLRPVTRCPVTGRCLSLPTAAADTASDSAAAVASTAAAAAAAANASAGCAAPTAATVDANAGAAVARPAQHFA
jgi:hypothetical protein